MANALLLLGLCACCYAQLIYPDEFERRRTSTVPSYDYSSTSRQSKTNPTAYRYRANSAPPQQVTARPQIAEATAGLTTQLSQQNYSAIQAGLGDNPLQNWGDHVNNIIVKGIIEFALDMDRTIYKSQPTSPAGQRENIIFSPISLAMTLAMVLLGSAGRTFDEVSKVLGLEAGIDISRHSEVVHQMFGVLLTRVHEKIVGSTGPRLDFASAVFVQDGYSIRPEFKAISESVYKSEVINLDFFGKGKEAQDRINGWVNEKTMGKISTILNDLPRPETSVILISALYFNGEWNQHFLTDATKRKPFFIEPNEAVDVDMMYNGGQFPFYEDRQLGVKILGLPYKGLEISMYVLLPTAKGAKALRDFQNRLTADILEKLIGNLKNETCIIALPRMKLSSTLSLRSALQTLGLSSLFDARSADLSLLSQGYGQQTMLPPTGTSAPPTGTVPTMSPQPVPKMQMGKNRGTSQLSNNNDFIVFPRFGGDEDSKGIRRNYFSYQDTIRGLTVEQWSTGFSIGRTRKMRAAGNDKGASFQEESRGGKDSYDVSDSEHGADNTRIVNLEQNKYRFAEKERAARTKRQNRPINQDFLNYIKSQNFPSFGLDDLRNSANLVNPHLYADDVLHKVEIDITEKGTEAAAVTSIVLERDGNQKRLIANRPFLFFIRHNPSGLLLFWGTLNTPTPNYSVT